jgi:hypothetical protein
VFDLSREGAQQATIIDKHAFTSVWLTTGAQSALDKPHQAAAQKDGPSQIDRRSFLLRRIAPNTIQ